MGRLIDADLLGLTDMEIIMCDGDYKEALKMLIDKIEHAPTIESERKKGKWVRCDTDEFRNMCKCSECGARIDIQEEFRSFFCYHCGADMRGGKQDG